MNLIKRNMGCSPKYYNYFDDIFGNNFPDLFFNDSASKLTMPSVNICEHEKEFALELAAPGYSKENFKINLSDNILTIKADVKDEKNEEDKKYSHREYYYSSFERRFTLPDNVDLKKIDANYEDGILHILLPKKEVSKEENSYEISIK